jgi:hypothetical protein
VPIKTTDRFVGVGVILLAGAVFSVVSWLDGYVGFALFFGLFFGFVAMMLATASEETLKKWVRWTWF